MQFVLFKNILAGYCYSDQKFIHGNFSYTNLT